MNAKDYEILGFTTTVVKLVKLGGDHKTYLEAIGEDKRAAVLEDLEKVLVEIGIATAREKLEKESVYWMKTSQKMIKFLEDIKPSLDKYQAERLQALLNEVYGDENQ